VCAAFTAAGLPCAVLMGPVVPFLSDSPAQLENTVRQIARAGAASVTPIVLHLRTGAREWFFRWLGEAHPDLVPRYRALYGRGAYAPAAYQKQVAGQVRELARRHGVGRGAPSAARHRRPGRFAPPAERRADPQAAAPQQLRLL
jgi:DNA repair photolyase